MIAEARNEGRKVHFASLMDLCHLKNSELEPKFQKYKGRIVLRADIVKDDTGSCAVFAEQGSSASQMTAAKVMDISSRLPGCAGQAADAVSAFSQVKNGRCTNSIKTISKSECPDKYGYVFQITNGPNHGPAWETQSFLLGEICLVILWQDYCGKSSIRTRLGKSSKMGMCIDKPSKRIILVCVWTIKTGWKDTKH